MIPWTQSALAVRRRVHLGDYDERLDVRRRFWSMENIGTKSALGELCTGSASFFVPDRPQMPRSEETADRPACEVRAETPTSCR